jgi:hypothetical protein
VTDVRTRIRELVDQARRVLDVAPDTGSRCSDSAVRDVCAALRIKDLPAALDEFMREAGTGESVLMQRWFPSARSGYTVLLEGRRRLEATQVAKRGLLGEVGKLVVFYLDVSGMVAWVGIDDGDDPPVMYLTEDASRGRVWAHSFTDWLGFVQPPGPFIWEM